MRAIIKILVEEDIMIKFSIRKTSVAEYIIVKEDLLHKGLIYNNNSYFRLGTVLSELPLPLGRGF